MSRFSLAVADGLVVLPDAGRIAVFGARADHDLSPLPKDRAEIIQGFFPDHQAIGAQGFQVSVEASGSYSGAIIFLPRAKAEARALVARACAVTGGGPVFVDGQKTDGIDSLRKDCIRHGGQVGPAFSKAHGKLFSLEKGDFSDWLAVGDAKIEGGFVTAPGVFSASGVDPASRLLAATLPDDLKGRVADLGAGWGYLAHHILRHEQVSECHLIEASHAALQCARSNISDPRARFHWADATAYRDEMPFSHVVTNPPFHTGRAADPSLGRAFIAAACRMLSGRGTLWLVANRHLPYEAALAEAFNDVEEISGDPSFKILRASKPRRAKR